VAVGRAGAIVGTAVLVGASVGVGAVVAGSAHAPSASTTITRVARRSFTNTAFNE